MHTSVLISNHVQILCLEHENVIVPWQCQCLISMCKEKWTSNCKKSCAMEISLANVKMWKLWDAQWLKQTCKYVVSMCITKEARLGREFVCKFCKPITWLCYSIHLIPHVTQLTDIFSLAMNTYVHFHSSLSMFSTMSCDKDSSLDLVTSYSFHLCFGLHPFALVSREFFECFLLLWTLHLNSHQTWLCKLFHWEAKHFKHFLLCPPSCTNT